MMKLVIILINRLKIIACCLILLLSTVASAQQAEFIWSEENETGSRIVLSVYQDGAWQPGKSIVEDNNWNLLPTLGADGNNQKLAVWSMIEDKRSLLKFATQRNGQWQPAQVISTQTSTNLAPVVVFDNKNTGWLFWSANSGGDDDIYMSTFISGTWSPPVRIHENNDVPDILPEAGMDESGNVWVSWQTLTDQGYVTAGMHFSASDRAAAGISNSISIEQVEQLKSRSASPHPMQPPPDFKSLGRASFYFPGDKIRPSRTIKGNLGL